jgi:hypothetical protein
MATDLETGSEASMTQLVSGIITDTQELIKQQIALLRHEVQEDLRKTKEASFSLIWGVGITLLGSVLVSLMLVHVVSWALPELHLWVCYGIVGAPIAVLGISLFYAGIHKFKSFNPLPDESVKAFKENVQWITNPK